ncbi:UrcA family protein [Hyphomonas sp. FCG-A18]|uniref:UrcA family protein n=1 Tax=Hyphomonas sp. FCG-A18 TaxID=3080019 RepID=UPI002B29AF3C|nr:UrcA family protein [Hyphomonas sp. FCG-A18]
MKSSKTIAGLAALAFLVAPMASAGSVEINTKPVSLAGLDLNSKAGAEIALNRIESAAKDVCEYDDTRWLRAWRNEASACVETAIAKAVYDRGHKGLTAHYKATHKNG